MSQEPTPKPISKSTRYDRQLRLWGDKGQATLESAHVCLINASAIGSETLKNLVLPGVGKITVVDSNKVMGRDLGNNFFLDQDSLGLSRADRVKELLLEINEEVTGESVATDINTLINENPEFFKQFSVVIATQVSEGISLPLSRLLWSQRVPLILVKSYGFIGSIRVATPEHCIVEAKPDNALEDLRFDKPFIELETHVNSVELDKLDKTEHEHVPYLVLIYKYLQKWSEQNGGRYPSKYKEKKEVKELIRQGIRINPETGGPEAEENFEEAMNNLNTALTETKVPSNIDTILKDDNCEQLTAQSTPFWILTAALKK
ncbi:NEDD8-activating enzyme E1 regulatory subunit isoform X1 [Oopsacas minuta]|uniref:NEDD8-activating enzyme E1 regulatory subunit n=1 Tax=Oopsacas minuta TaxID=111878 RepID=A0AAV7JRI9_9METZ|nr:NEDD8-activating enzyme E1 regulatory subunit isoform X1 [Oopsacas minuta]